MEEPLGGGLAILAETTESKTAEEWLAKKADANPAAFMGLVGKLPPRNMEHHVRTDQTIADILEALATVHALPGGGDQRAALPAPEPE